MTLVDLGNEQKVLDNNSRSGTLHSRVEKAKTPCFRNHGVETSGDNTDKTRKFC